MCGIFGFSELTDVTRRMTPFLAWEMESRGKDSWGATDGQNLVKIVGAITDSFYEWEDHIGSWDRGIFHTRGASTGDVTRDNAHPFEGVSDDGTRRVVGIHNGIVSNHEELNTKYSRKCEVDSMHIFHHLAKRLPTSEIRGWGNLAWYEYDADNPNGTLYLLRFNNDSPCALHIASLVTGEFVFCSQKDPIVRAAQMAGSMVDKFWPLKEEKKYSLRPLVEEDGSVRYQLWVAGEYTRFGTRYGPVRQMNGIPIVEGRHNNSTTPWPPYAQHRHRPAVTFANLQLEERRTGTCAAPGCRKQVTQNRTLNLICEACFMEAVGATA